MPISEILDRYTITKLKSERTSEDVSEELAAYKKEMDEYGPDQINIFIQKLYEVNGNIWDTEGDIRNGKDLPLEEIGKLALKVRDLNCERNGVKADVVEKFSEGYKEIKINYQKVDYGRN